MDTAAFAFCTLVLFMLHEFEEIICFHSYVAKHSDDPAYGQDPLVRHGRSFPSAETVAIMIAEEFVLVSIVLGVAIWTDSFELVLAATLVNLLHLLVHIGGLLRVRRMLPGGWTAVLTAVATTGLLAYALIGRSVDMRWTIIAVLVMGPIVAGNLWMLTSNASAIERIRLRMMRRGDKTA